MTEQESYDAYVKLLASQPENERYYETIILSHSKFSKTYYLVIDNAPLTANLTTGEEVTFEPANIKAVNAQNSNDLDQLAAFSISDVNNILDDELDNIPLGDTESPVIGYGIYVTNNLTVPSDYVEYTAKNIAQKKGAFTLNCGVPSLNKDETGEVFSLERFPMLRGV